MGEIEGWAEARPWFKNNETSLQPRTLALAPLATPLTLFDEMNNAVQQRSYYLAEVAALLTREQRDGYGRGRVFSIHRQTRICNE